MTDEMIALARRAVAFSVAALIVVLFSASVAACAEGKPPAPRPLYGVAWHEVTPPRPGLRCWMHSPETRAAVLFCEPDPTATRNEVDRREEEK